MTSAERRRGARAGEEGREQGLMGGEVGKVEGPVDARESRAQEGRTEHGAYPSIA